MIFVTGDIHAWDDIRKLAARRWPEGRSLTKSDCLVVAGDFGLYWSDPPEHSDEYWLDWLHERGWTTLWVDGNHENHDLIDAMPITRWCGGDVNVDEKRPDIIHLRRGQVYDVPAASGHSVRLFTFGGARSHDIQYRKEGRTWWAREMPGESEFREARMNLERCGWSVDYVVTHDCPGRLKHAVLKRCEAGERGAADPLNVFLDEIDDRLTYGRWYFGHYHTDRDVDGRHTCLYNEIVMLGDCGL